MIPKTEMLVLWTRILQILPISTNTTNISIFLLINLWHLIFVAFDILALWASVVGERSCCFEAEL